MLITDLLKLEFDNSYLMQDFSSSKPLAAEHASLRAKQSHSEIFSVGRIDS